MKPKVLRLRLSHLRGSPQPLVGLSISRRCKLDRKDLKVSTHFRGWDFDFFVQSPFGSSSELVRSFVVESFVYHILFTLFRVSSTLAGKLNRLSPIPPSRVDTYPTTF